MLTPTATSGSPAGVLVLVVALPLFVTLWVREELRPMIPENSPWFGPPARTCFSPVRRPSHNYRQLAAVGFVGMIGG